MPRCSTSRPCTREASLSRAKLPSCVRCARLPYQVLALDNVIDIFDTAGAAPALIEEDADSKFKRSKKRALLQNIVPFLPLSRNDMRWVAARELKELGKHLSAEYTFCWGGQLTWSPPICDWMANQCHADDTCRLDGGRGIDTMVISSVNPK